jgi:hypothetical protein
MNPQNYINMNENNYNTPLKKKKISTPDKPNKSKEFLYYDKNSNSITPIKLEFTDEEKEDYDNYINKLYNLHKSLNFEN